MPRRRSTPSVGVVGVGYVGLATGLAFAHHGLRVLAYDSNPTTRRRLRLAKSPYREAGLEQLLRAQSRSRRIRPVDDLPAVLRGTEAIFLCVPTPRGTGGSIDLAPVLSAVRSLARELAKAPGYRLIVVKSTVVPGTTVDVIEPLLRRESGKGVRELGVACNPEFLAEGSMVRDALHPERIVLGVSDPRSAHLLREVYRRFAAPIFELSPSGAELVKYSANAFLAQKVSFANEVGRLCERLGENVDHVMEAVGADARIGRRFLRAGPGFGGSCFDKDLRAIVSRADELGVRFRTARSALAANEDQMRHVLRLLQRSAGTLRGRTVTVLGVAFKAGSDDVRESRAFPIVRGLLDKGARVRLHDPFALHAFSREWVGGGWGRSGDLTLCRSPANALRGADLAVLQADWPEYRRWSAAWTRGMRRPILVDLRRSISKATAARSGLDVIALGVGRPSPVGRRNPLPGHAIAEGGTP
ncbi:MAG: UDP-glucose dehydrogenase family protein [Thermoplasmata archaeon]